MKKTCILVVFLLLLFSTISVFAAVGDDCTVNSDCETGEICENQKCVIDDSEESKIQEGFDCLEQKAQDCTGLTTQELALTILATPDNIFSDCVNELKNRESGNNWGNIRDTALAVLALDHAGYDTQEEENWILSQNKTPSDLTWYIQQDSNEAAECHIAYGAQDYTINVGEDKKIDENAGSCLTKANSDYWLKISSSCYEEEFQIECNKNFIANLLYQNPQSSTIYVLDETSSAQAFNSVTLSVKSKCFGEIRCEYEATLWAALALLSTDHNIEEFIPYIVAGSETNERYLPEAFIYILTSYEDYAGNLILKQKLGNYWEATSSAYNKYYDTALALIALDQSTSEQVSSAKDWLYFSQGSNGCWNNQVRDTAMVLWVLVQREGKMPVDPDEPIADDITSITYCSDVNYFCIPSEDCPVLDDVGDNYFCPSLSATCCISENLKTCSDLGGEVCASGEVCAGNSKKASDTDDCCTGTCKERAEVEENECEANYYTCMDECSEFQVPITTYECNQGQVCCRTKSSEDTIEEAASKWWIWVLVVLIAAVLIAIIYVYRNQLERYWFQLKTKFKKEGGVPPTSRGPGPGMPPRPGFPPIRRRPMPQQIRPMPLAQPKTKEDSKMSDTFRKLREMSR